MGIRVNFNKGLAMDAVCSTDDLRPAMGCIYFENGFAYATDGSLLVRNEVSECSSIDEEQIGMLNGKMINSESYKNLLRYDVIVISEDGIEAQKGSQKAFFYFADIDGKYPNAEKVLQDVLNKATVPMPSIMLNTSNLIKLNKALSGSDKCTYTFKGQGNAVILQGDGSNHVGLIMPYYSENV
ncbi:MAG: hypothetical protein PHX50_17700 [Massilibacteroides sp.]|nr:hypothetical protein [Massilibacteroides sp.]